MNAQPESGGENQDIPPPRTATTRLDVGPFLGLTAPDILCYYLKCHREKGNSNIQAILQHTLEPSGLEFPHF